MTTIGFVIVSHREEAQLLRLTQSLNRLYGNPPIACHHDFDQASLSLDRFSSNIDFVRPHFRTAWGKWVVVDATLAALALLYEGGGPDWFVLLSASDYPIRRGDEVVSELAASPFDAYLDARPISGAKAAASLHGELNPKLGHLSYPSIERVKWSHYLGAELWIPIIRRRPRWRLGRYTIHLPFAARNRLPERFGMFHGDHWFTGNRRTAQTLLNPRPEHLILQRHLRMRSSPDECYYQTVLANTAGLSICLNNKRYADWTKLAAHPKDLTEPDLPEMFASGAHFARKFAPGSAALGGVDERLGITVSV